MKLTSENLKEVFGLNISAIIRGNTEIILRIRQHSEEQKGINLNGIMRRPDGEGKRKPRKAYKRKTKIKA